MSFRLLLVQLTCSHQPFESPVLPFVLHFLCETEKTCINVENDVHSGLRVNKKWIFIHQNFDQVAFFDRSHTCDYRVNLVLHLSLWIVLRTRPL